jgi:NADH-quinone oxidoreductase subunit L
MPIDTGDVLKWLLFWAWMLPLFGFVLEIFAGRWQRDRRSTAAARWAVGCIGTGFLLSLWALITYVNDTGWEERYQHEARHHHELMASLHGHGDEHGHGHDHGHDEHDHDNHGHDARETEQNESEDADEGGDDAAAEKPGAAQLALDDPGAGEGQPHHGDAGHGGARTYAGTFYRLAQFGSLSISIDYYIDTLTLVMFTMVTFIATCIHIFAMGYMADELTDDYVDHHAHTADGKHLHRPGRFHRFFAFLSLFSFSMLGLVLAGNIFQVFVFWELVGVCSYFLIGFYTERHSASSAANKAFIMNRVGDFGFLIGLMALWTSFGTFQFAEPGVSNPDKPAGLFQMVRSPAGELDVDEAEGVVYLFNKDGTRKLDPQGLPASVPYWLLVVAGLGIFAGCIGKSAQFPLQTWLPDAMEGPTPVSALVHSATMVAAGVYLAGRFYPMFTPEVLLTIAYIGGITLFVAATIAMVVTDLKKVLAYSTISQLGYMMLALGVFGWAAGLFHLITHAFFKSLMFLSSGSVIAACHHEQEMPKMGGLIKKMPVTGLAMLVGVIAIAGLSIPGLTFGDLGMAMLLLGVVLGVLFYLRQSREQLWISAALLLVGAICAFSPFAAGTAAFSGYHSKDAIVATSLTFFKQNPQHFLLFFLPLITAGITAFYMFRLWFYTFVGKPRDQHLYDHCRESPLVMTGPLIALSVLAIFCAIGGEAGKLFVMINESAPPETHHAIQHAGIVAVNLPGHADVAANHAQAGSLATIAAFLGTLIAFVIYGIGLIDPAEVKKSLAGFHSYLSHKWYFDEIYDTMFVKPMHAVASLCAAIDRIVFDRFLHGLCAAAVSIAKWDRLFDERVVDGLVNLMANVTYAVGGSFRRLQTGQLRQYLMLIAVAVIMLSVILFVWFPR